VRPLPRAGGGAGAGGGVMLAEKPPEKAPEGSIDNRLFILILQHPQERREALGTAGPTRARLRRAELKTGLSWPNLARALGHPADPRRWAVLYLGSVRPAEFGLDRPVIALDRAGAPLADQDRALRGLDGAVLLDGSWKEAKTLWWRNPWLLKLHRLVLAPAEPSCYLRREPRREALSTLEAVALLLDRLDPNPGCAAALLAELAAPARRAG
jgi:tRNA-uridine aminocarboxypropyltransferase